MAATADRTEIGDGISLANAGAVMRQAPLEATVWSPAAVKTKIGVLVGATLLTLAIHYGWVIEPLFGHAHWVHAIHGRFCYIPIVIAAAWFGLRGGVIQASVISALVLPYIFSHDLAAGDYAGELVEIVFYFAIALLTGFLVQREFRARRRQQDAELQLERSQKLSLVGQIAAGVAHEVKNPLASIKGAADILSDDSASEADRREFTEILKNEVRRIDGTVTEFLSFARPKETRFQRLDPAEILRTSVRQVETQARQAEIVISTQLAEGLTVNADPEKLHQLMLNLALNAVQASAAGSRVDVRLKRGDSGQIVLTVSDCGSGISPEDRERIFEPFFTTRPTGVGLGLAIARTIVEDHHGHISVQSAPGEGTTFTVVLPGLDARSES